MTSPYGYLAAGYQQVAFVVRDIAEAERFFSAKLGVPRLPKSTLGCERDRKRPGRALRYIDAASPVDNPLESRKTEN